MAFMVAPILLPLCGIPFEKQKALIDTHYVLFDKLDSSAPPLPVKQMEKNAARKWQVAT